MPLPAPAAGGGSGRVERVPVCGRFRPPTVSIEELGLLMTGASTDTEDGAAAAGPVAQAGPLDAVGGTTGAETPGSPAAEAGDTGQPGQEEPS